jgi:hypothetical protein
MPSSVQNQPSVSRETLPARVSMCVNISAGNVSRETLLGLDIRISIRGRSRPNIS